MAADTVTLLTRQVFLGDTAAAGVLADAWEERGDADEETLAVLRALVPLLRVQGPPRPPFTGHDHDGRLGSVAFATWFTDPVHKLPSREPAEGVAAWLRRLGAVERRGHGVRTLPCCATLAVRREHKEQHEHGYHVEPILYRPSPRRPWQDVHVAAVFFVPHVEATEVLRRWYLPGAADAVNAFMRTMLHEDGFHRRIMPLQPLDDVEVGGITRADTQAAVKVLDR